MKSQMPPTISVSWAVNPKSDFKVNKRPGIGFQGPPPLGHTHTQ